MISTWEKLYPDSIYYGLVEKNHMVEVDVNTTIKLKLNEEWLTDEFKEMCSIINTKSKRDGRREGKKSKKERIEEKNKKEGRKEINNRKEGGKNNDYGENLKLSPVLDNPLVYQTEYCVLNIDFCSELINNVVKQCKKDSLNMVGVSLLNTSMNYLMEQFIDLTRPLFQQLFPDMCLKNRNLQGVYVYMIKYDTKDGSDRLHPPHVDDCDITVNICLGGGFKGGELYFLDATSNHVKGIINHKEGCAIIHQGSAVHGANPITEGERYNLIMWFKASWSFHLFSLLPVELQVNIFSFLSTKDLWKLRGINHSIRNIAERPNLWSYHLNNIQCELEHLISQQSLPPNKEHLINVCIKDSLLQMEESRQYAHKCWLQLYNIKKKYCFPNKEKAKEMRKRVIEEWTNTEKSHYEDIQTTLKIKEVLLENGVPVERVNDVFRNLHMLAEVSKMRISIFDNFLIKFDTESHSFIAKEANLLPYALAFYRQYAITHTAAQLKAVSLEKDYPKAFKKAMESVDVRGLTLPSLLQAPVRRTPRHALIARELRRNVEDPIVADGVLMLEKKIESQMEKLYHTS